MLDKEYIEKSSWYKSVADAIRNKKGTTDPILRDDFASEISSITGGGSGECSGEHIIEVDTLPETGEDGAIYKLTQAFSDIVIYVGGVILFREYAAAEGITVEYYAVSTKPTDNIRAIDETNRIFPCYYVKDENDIFLYHETNGWLSFSLVMEISPFNGEISDASEATTFGYYALGGGILYCQYINGTWELMIYESNITSEEQIVTPTTSAQEITPTSADYLSKVTVNAIPSKYIVPSGTLSIDTNGTHDVTNKASVNVNVLTSYMVETAENLPTDAPQGALAIVWG